MVITDKKDIKSIAEDIQRERVNMGSIHYVLIGQYKNDMHKNLREGNLQG